MHPRRELKGQVFGRLVVLEFAGMRKYSSQWLCRCECGTEKIFDSKNLVAGRSRSCGCKQGGRSGLYGAVKRTHGLSNKSPIYDTWVNIRQRCHNPNNPYFYLYGGRGIEVCEEWRASYEAFHRDMAPTWQKGLTIERIFGDLGYAPGNCIWMPMSEQWKTRRTHGPKRKPNERYRGKPGRRAGTA